MNPDTRVALVREDMAKERIKKALLSAKEDAFLSIDAQVDAILAELFPRTDKPLTRNQVQAVAERAEYYSGQYYNAAGYEEMRDLRARIEEELNRG